MNNLNVRWNNLKNSFETLKQDFADWLFPVWVTANHLSAFRLLLLIPLFVCNSLGQHFLVLVFFTCAVVTDALDGPLARKRNQVSEFGKILDPLADKLTILAVINPLLLATGEDYHRWGFWVACLVLGFDFLLTILGGIKYCLPPDKLPKYTISANKFGKIKMFCQSVGLMILIVSNLSQSAFTKNLALTILTVSIPFSLLSILGHLLGFGLKKNNKTASL